MTIDPRITILLTLKGRPLFTLRWLWHASRVGLPFSVLIADGEVDSTIARVLEKADVFPNLRFEYHRYNDHTLSDFYRKLQDALSKIKTPYVMLSDNDDFLFPSGIIKSLDYLDRSPDYVSVGGGIGHFEIRDGASQHLHVHGRIARLWYQQARAYQAFDLHQSLASERVCETYTGSLTVHYNVNGLEALRCVVDELTLHDFHMLESGEVFWKLRLATLGKIKSDSSYVSYFRQLGTSFNPLRETDFISRISNEGYIGEMQRAMKIIAAVVAKVDGTNQDVVEERLEKISAEHLRKKLIQMLGWRATVKSYVKKVIPESVLRQAQVVGDRIRSGKSSTTGGRPMSHGGIFKLTAGAGAPKELIETQRRELAEMEATLQGREFLAFVRLQAPELLLEKRGHLAAV